MASTSGRKSAKAMQAGEIVSQKPSQDDSQPTKIRQPQQHFETFDADGKAYGLAWPEGSTALDVESSFVRAGGYIKLGAKRFGQGYEFHFRNVISLLLPKFWWNIYSEILLNAWCNNKYIGVAGPASCVRGDTRIPNPITGECPTIEYLCNNGIRPTVMTLGGPMIADVPFLKGVADLFEVTLDNGQVFVATGQHRVLTTHGYECVEQLKIGQSLPSYDQHQIASNSGFYQSIRNEDGPRLTRIIEDSQSGYQRDFRLCGEQLLAGKADAQCASPLPVGVHGHIHDGLPLDGLSTEQECIHPCQHSFHLSTPGNQVQASCKGNDASSRLIQGTPSREFDLFQQSPQSWSTKTHRQPYEQPDRDSFDTQFLSSCGNKYAVQRTCVKGLKWVGKGPYYDVHVPIFNHYFAEGAIHHNTGKSYTMAAFAYATFYCWPQGTTIIMSSTSIPGLKLRVWAALMKIINDVKRKHPDAPGHVVNYIRSVFSNEPSQEELTAQTDAIIGIACKPGDTVTGISSYVGVKNSRVIGIFDEASMMQRAFWDATSNLSKNPDSKFVAMGNPLSLTDALGVICEPAKEDGGWDGYVEVPCTRMWKTRMGGVAVQLSGYDSPNYKYAKGLNPYPNLITPEKIEHDLEYYGADSWQVKAMNFGVFPKSEGSRRVITRALCDQHRAFDKPIWSGLTKIVNYGGADIAYTIEDGDRSVLINIQVGEDKDGRKILALVDRMVLSIQPIKGVAVEEQIASAIKAYCERRDILPEHFGMDSTGRGNVVSTLSKIWSTKFHAVEFGGQPDERRATASSDKQENELYTKRVSALWFAWRNVILHGQLRGLTESAFLEGSMREFIVNPKNGKEDVEPKADTRARLGKSPDEADAVVVAIEVARRNGFLIGMGTEARKRFDMKALKRSEEYRSLWSRASMVGA